MSKRTTVISLLAVALLLLFTVTRTWIVFELDPQAAVNSTVLVAGKDGMGALLPVTIALIALAVVLGIAGKVLKYIIGSVVTVFGAWISVTLIQLSVQGPEALFRFGESEIAETTGLLGHAAGDLVMGMEETIWPWVGVALGAVTLLLGLQTLVVAGRWRSGGQRYETRQGAQQRPPTRGEDRIADWDDLSDGNDPTGHSREDAEHGRLEEND